MSVKKSFQAVISLVLALLIVFPVLLSSCASTSSDTQTNNTDAVTSAPVESDAVTTDSNVDANGFLKDSLPADLNFGGKEVGILYWSDVERQEFESAAITGENVNDAIYERNSAVQSRLGVTLKWYPTKGNNDNRAVFQNYYAKSYNAGEHNIDILASYTRTAAQMAVEGYAIDLMNVKYLDLSKPWWPASVNDSLSIGGKLYFISGDISTNLLHMMYGVYSNKDLIKDNSLEDPTELVKNGKWTIAKLMEMSEGIYKDLNGNDKKDVNDLYGFTTASLHNAAFYTGSGLRLLEADSENLLKISPDYSSEKAISLIDWIGNWERTGGCCYYNSDSETVFKNGNAVFQQNRAYYAERQLRDVTFSYGILPTPKYDEAQENYITCIANPATLYNIAIGCLDTDAAGAVLECLGSEAYRRTTPALFETNMKFKYSSASVDSEMFDIVRNCITIDIGRIFSGYLEYMAERPSDCMLGGTTSWATQSAMYLKLYNIQLKKVIEKLKALS